MGDPLTGNRIDFTSALGPEDMPPDEAQALDELATRNGYGKPQYRTVTIRLASGRTERQNAIRFCSMHGQDVRWCDPWGKWLCWDGTRWKLDDRRLVETLAKQTADSHWEFVGEACKGVEAAEARAIVSFARQSASARGIANMIALARSEAEIPVLPDSFDQDPWLFNVKNGTIDLRTGKLRPHRKEDFLTRIASVEYDADACCARWRRFLREVFVDNPGLIEFFKRAAGYSLTASTRERCLFFLHGSGRNGKTTAISTLQHVFGEYATGITIDLLMVRKGEAHPTEVCDLAGRRLAVATETEDGRRLAESFVKHITGGEDRLKGRRMREDFWEFPATFKLWISGNHKPRIRGTDDGIWDRVKLVPFKVRFQNPDKTLPRKLLAESPGILRWAVDGCLDWQRDGLAEPEEVTQATAEYRQESDIIGQFVAECCIEDPQARCKSAHLFDAYAEWTEKSKEYAVSRKSFGEAMTERGYERYSSDGVWYRGIGLREP